MDESELTAAERKKARRKSKGKAERTAADDLNALTAAAVEEALRLAPEVAETPGSRGRRLLEAEVPTEDAARFIIKRINEALAFHEFLEEVDASIKTVDGTVKILLQPRRA